MFLEVGTTRRAPAMVLYVCYGMAPRLLWEIEKAPDKWKRITLTSRGLFALAQTILRLRDCRSID